MNPKSIRDINPIDQSGRDAKRGFAYQDHVGVRLCLDMLLEKEIIEVWVEKEDDLTIIRSLNGKEQLEFCQVKHTQEKGSRWSVADICKRDNTKSGIGKCFIEKSLEQDRSIEDATFRVISSYPITSDLKCLSDKISSVARTNNKTILDTLAKTLKDKIGDVKSAKGTNIKIWVHNCYWQKFPDSVADLRNANILLLEKVISTFAIQLLPNHRDDLYQMILQKVYEASSCDLRVNPNGYKIIHDNFLIWIKEKAQELLMAIKNDKLEEKLIHAGCDRSLVLSARTLKFQFKQEKLSSDYIKPKNLIVFEEAILEKLHDLKIDLLSDDIKLNGVQFLSLCNKEIKKLAEDMGTVDNGLSSKLGKGIMYDLTSKCIHRFTKEIS